MNCHDFSFCAAIDKGWSADKKYMVIGDDGQKYLLRVSPLERRENINLLFSLMKQVEQTGAAICRPISLEGRPDGIYALYSWIDGLDATEAVPAMNIQDQYSMGVESGRILKLIHSIPAPPGLPPWHTRFERKARLKIEKYRACPVSFVGDREVIDFIEKNLHLIKARPQCFQHGDYHIGNMMASNRQITVIDFDRFDFGDPWEEFNRIVWSAQAAPAFASGQLDGYFGGKPPCDFFTLLALYISVNTLSSVTWSIPFGQESLSTMLAQIQDILIWYDGMKNHVPRWYQYGGYIEQT